MDQRLPAETDTAADRYNRRIGLMLFTAYFIGYAVFVVMVYRDWTSMAKPMAGGLNVAIVYGMSLIVSAFIISLIYMAIAKKN